MDATTESIFVTSLGSDEPEGNSAHNSPIGFPVWLIGTAARLRTWSEFRNSRDGSEETSYRKRVADSSKTFRKMLESDRASRRRNFDAASPYDAAGTNFSDSGCSSSMKLAAARVSIESNSITTFKFDAAPAVAARYSLIFEIASREFKGIATKT